MLPLLLILLFGIATLGHGAAVASSLQQLAADAARSAIGGLTDAERLARVNAQLDSAGGAFPLLSPARISRDVQLMGPPQNAVRVTLDYDLEGTLFDVMDSLLGLGIESFRRSAYLAFGPPPLPTG